MQLLKVFQNLRGRADMFDGETTHIRIHTGITDFVYDSSISDVYEEAKQNNLLNTEVLNVWERVRIDEEYISHLFVDIDLVYSKYVGMSEKNFAFCITPQEGLSMGVAMQNVPKSTYVIIGTEERSIGTYSRNLVRLFNEYDIPIEKSLFKDYFIKIDNASKIPVLYIQSQDLPAVSGASYFNKAKVLGGYIKDNCGFEEYLSKRGTKVAHTCCEYIKNNHLCLQLVNRNNHNILFFVSNQDGAGVIVPKYMEEEAQRFLKAKKIQGIVCRDASFFIVEYQDNHNKDIMRESYMDIYKRYAITKGYPPIKIINKVCDNQQIVTLLYKALSEQNYI